MGTIGGFLGWLLQENLIHYSVQQDLLKGTWYSVPLTAGQVRTLIYCVGGLIGMCLGAVEGIVESNPRKLVQGIGLGALTGVILGFMGYNFGGLLYHVLGGSDEISRDAGMGAFARQVIARAFGWSLMGLGLGIGAALPTRSLARIRNGAIGGFLGGFLGGFIFDLIAPASNVVQAATAGSGVREVGGPSRAAGFTAIGGLTGLLYRAGRGVAEAGVGQGAGRAQRGQRFHSVQAGQHSGPRRAQRRAALWRSRLSGRSTPPFARTAIAIS